MRVDAISCDAECTKYLERSGYRVLRVWNDEVFKNMQGVTELVLQLLENVPNSPPSSPALLPRGRRERIEAGSCSVPNPPSSSPQGGREICVPIE